MSRRFSALALAVGLALSTLAPASAQRLTEVGALAGVDHVHVDPALMGGGAALFDYDGDGDLDLYLTSGRSRDALYRNDGGFSFTEVGEAAGLGLTTDLPTMGVVTADVDNDGDRDVFVTTQRGAGHLLLRNNGDGTFSDISAEAGLSDADRFSSSATFADVNLDGWVDLYVTNYIEEQRFITDENGVPVGFDHVCFADELYVNDGDGTFTEQAAAYGITESGCGLATGFSDVDGDTDPDLFVVNDFGAWIEPNGLLRNEALSAIPQPLFTDVTDDLGAGSQIYGMGIAAGDFDGDGDLDYYMTNLGANVLLRNDLGAGAGFLDVAADCGVLNERTTPDLFSTSWGTAFADLDQDGILDLLVANGHMPSFDFLANDPFAPDKLFLGTPDGTFSDKSDTAGFASTAVARGLATGDLDGDGDLDVVVVVVDGDGTDPERTLLYRNDSETGNRLAVDVEGVNAARDGYGTRVEVVAGGQRWIREVDGGSSYLSHSATTVHVGLGAVTRADSVIVTWPGGARDVLTDVDAGQTVAVREGQFPTDRETAPAGRLRVLSAAPNPVRGEATIAYQAAAPVTLRIYDALGRRVETQHAARHEGTFQWRPEGLAAGLYVYTLASGGETARGTLTVLP